MESAVLPRHEDFQKIHKNFIDEYGEEEGEKNYYAWLNKMGYDDTKPMPKKEGFSWAGSIKEIPGVTNLIRGEALHPIKTYHYEEWPEVRVYLEEELEKSAHTLADKPLLLDHYQVLHGKVLGAEYEDGAIEYVAELNDPGVMELIRNGTIKHCSVEFEWRSLDKLNGFSPRNITFTGLSLLRLFEPGDPQTTVELFESIVKQLKEAKNVHGRAHPGSSTAKEQAEPQEFILYTLRDPQAFLPEHFSTSWIDQTNGVQGIFGRLREDPENSVPQALLFMKANNWDLPKMQDWLQNHPQYLRASAPAKPGIQPASGDTGVMKMSKEKRPQTLEGRVTFLETLQRLKEQELTEEEIKQKIAELNQQKADLDAKLYPEAELSEEEKTNIQAQIEVLYAEIQAYEQALAKKIAGEVPPEPEKAPKTIEEFKGKLKKYPEYTQKKYLKLLEAKVPLNQLAKLLEAEWDTEYINDLPDSAFAVIAPGGEKDEQGKTVPRTLRKLPHHNMQGNLDLSHLRAALARLNQIEPANLQQKAKKHLCGHARSEKAEDLVSEFCGEEPPATEQQGDQEPEKDEHGCLIGKEVYDKESGKCVPIETGTEQQGEEKPPEAGEPKTDRQRFMDHYGLTEEQMSNVLEWIGEDVYKLLPEPGTKRQQQAEESRKKGLGEAIIDPGATPEPSDLISRKEVLALIPERRIWRSWSYGPQRLVQDLKRKLKEGEA